MKILIMGRTELLYETVLELKKSHEIVGIITAPASPEYYKKESDFESLARELKCPFLLTSKLNSAAERFIAEQSPDIAVSVNWVSVIEESVFRLIPKGILNAHCGDLPRYRGNAVMNWALLAGEPDIAMSIHYMVPGELDSGDILAQQKLKLGTETTIKDIVDFSKVVTPKLFDKAISEIANGKSKPIKQKSRGLTEFRCYPRLPIDSKINWTLSAVEIDRLVRASTEPYSGAYTYLKEDDQIRRVYVWSSRVVQEETKDLGTPGHIVRNDKISGESWVFTGRGILAIKLAQYEGEEMIQPGKVWRSIRMRFGIDIENELAILSQRLKG